MTDYKSINTKNCEHVIDKELYCYKKSKNGNNMLLTWNKDMQWITFSPMFEGDLP